MRVSWRWKLLPVLSLAMLSGCPAPPRLPPPAPTVPAAPAPAPPQVRAGAGSALLEAPGGTPLLLLEASE